MEAANQELGKLDRQAVDVDKKFKEATSNVSLLEQSLKQSSQGALQFNESLSKSVVTANQLAQNLITAGKAINAYNANLPPELKKEKAFQFAKLEEELRAPMQNTALAASQLEEKVKAVKEEIPRATRELQEKRREWERINEQADEHLAKLERIRFASREWGFKLEGLDAGGEYSPAYGSS